jgi:hypothetical protein
MKSFYPCCDRTQPTPLFSALLFALSALLLCNGPAAHAQTTITQWNFNSSPPDANTGTGITTPSTGTGTASLAGSTSATFASGDANGGSTDPATGDDSGWNVSSFAAQGTADRSQGAQFLVSTVGFQNISVRWDQRHSNTAPRHVQLQYTTNGSTWTDLGSPFEGTAGDTWFNNRSANLSAITAANNNPSFGIRIVAAFAPATSAYTASNTASSYSTSGTWRLDMVTVSGTPLCVNPAGTLANNGPVCPGGTVNLTFNASVGTGPFSIIVNGIGYPNVTSGSPFATLTEGVNFSGNTTFTLTDIADANNCSVSGLNEQTTVTVSSSSNVVITATPNPIGQGNVLNLSVPSAGAGATYNWSGSGVVNANANATTAMPTAGGAQTYAVTVTNASNCVSTGTVSVSVIPAVTLSVSANAGTEAASTAIAVTATASAPVAGNQTVTLGVSGTGITAADYYLSRTTLTILSGQTTATATFTIADDGATEGPETAALTLASPSAGIVLGSPFSQNIAITDNACSFLRKIGGFASANGAEISGFDPASQRVYVVAGNVMEILSMSSTGALTLVGTLPFGFTAPSGTTALPNSVAVKNGIVAVSYAIVTNGSNAQQPGRLGLYTAATGAFLNVVTTGALPDMVAFTPDGLKVLTADEGEPNSYGQGNSLDPEGSVTIIDLSGGVAAATVQTATFTSFNSQMATLRAAGVRIYGPGATVAQDLEPEYIAISPDGLTARVTLQENNAIAVLDIPSATFTSIQPLGLKNHNTPGNGLDPSDQDGPSINIQNWPVFGMYQPDAIAPYTVGGQTYYITANEGDSRAYTGFNEEIRVGAAGYVLDPAAFPNAATLKMNANLGRLQLTNATGDTDGDGDFDQIQALGARSFSIWASNGNLVFDSGDQLEQITAAKSPTVFNSDGAAASFDGRSDNKGPEPEGVAVGTINGVTYAFIGLERVGDVMVYDVTNPAAPVFVQYMNLPEDLGVEGLVFVPAANSPTGNALLITAAEVSRTTTVYEIGVPTIQIAVAETSGVANNDGIICSNNSATLTASGAVSYLWSTGANSSATTVSAAGVYTVTATKSNGCTGTATFTLTVNPAPTVSLSGATSFCAGGSTVLTATGNPTNYLWNTSATSASITVTTGGNYTVTVNGSNGCFATASATVVAHPLPTVTCPSNLTVCIATPVFPLAGSSPTGGTYSGAGVSAGQFDPVLAGVGTHTITYAYTDGNGCFGSCTYTITVHPQPNTLVSAASPVAANSTGNTASVENAGTGATYVWSITNGTITAGAGTPSITYTAGASGTVELSVMVSNFFCGIPGTANIAIAPAPQFSCPPSIVRTTSADGITGDCVFNGLLTHPATSGPNTPISLAVAFSNGSPAPSALPTGGAVTAGASGTYGFYGGKTVVTYTATDNLSNAATCSFTVQVTDNELPSIVCPANIVRNNDANQCGAAVTYATPTVADNCSAVTPVRTSGPASGSVFPKGTTMVSWRVTDASGNSAVCGFTVTVNDAQAPTLTCPANQTRSTDPNQCSAAVTYANPTASDNCSPAPTVTLQSPANAGSGASFPKGVTVVTWRATDAAGLTKTCTFRVTVNDTQAPNIACPLSRTVNTNAGLCTAVTNYATPTFTDNCPGGLVNLISGLPSGATFPKGTTNVTWRATDAAGLTKTCSFAVTVLDNQVPTIMCPSSVTATAAAGECSTEVTYAAPTATDNCGSIQSIQLLSGLVSGSIFPQGNTLNIWRATDGNGLSRTCSFTVTVNCGTGAQGTGLADRAQKLDPDSATSNAEIAALNFRLAPNPAITEVQILLEKPAAESVELWVHDAQGRTMWKQAVPPAAQSLMLTLADLPAGLYFVALRTEKAVVAKRLSVSKL